MEEKEVKKTTNKKKVVISDETKILEAKKKINDLLRGTGLEDKKESIEVSVEDLLLPVSDSDKSNEWLNDQIIALTQEVEQLQNIVVNLQNENKHLKTNGTSVQSIGSDMVSDQNKIIEIYKHFENVYTGKNSYGQPFAQVKFSNPERSNGVLDMFISTFPFLEDYKNYRHWG